jgi:TetR/AcrR family transcriptional regulator, tetracycline repressor protein
VVEKLTRTAVLERAAKLADAEGLDTVTIRRLAQELGVTPMALYWHFKNKDELLVGLADHLLDGVKATRSPDDPWLQQLRAMVEALLDVMRVHPSLPELLMLIDKSHATAFTRATNDALDLLSRGGYDLEEGYWVSSYLLHGAIGLVEAQPGCPTTMTPPEAEEWRRQRRLALESLPVGQFPMMVAFAGTLQREPDIERYFAFGIDVLMSGVEAMAVGRGRRVTEQRPPGGLR